MNNRITKSKNGRRKRFRTMRNNYLPLSTLRVPTVSNPSIAIAVGLGGITGATILGPVGAVVAAKVTAAVAVKVLSGTVCAGVGAMAGSRGAQTMCKYSSRTANNQRSPTGFELQNLLIRFGDPQELKRKQKLVENLRELALQFTDCCSTRMMVRELESTLMGHMQAMVMSSWSGPSRWLRLLEERCATERRGLKKRKGSRRTLVEQFAWTIQTLRGFLFRQIKEALDLERSSLEEIFGETTRWYGIGFPDRLVRAVVARVSEKIVLECTGCCDSIFEMIRSGMEPKQCRYGPFPNVPVWEWDKPKICDICKSSNTKEKWQRTVRDIQKDLFSKALSTLSRVQYENSTFAKLDCLHEAYTIVTVLASALRCCYCLAAVPHATKALDGGRRLTGPGNQVADSKLFEKCIHYSSNASQEGYQDENKSSTSNVADSPVEIRFDVPCNVCLDELLPVAYEVAKSCQLQDPFVELEYIRQVTGVSNYSESAQESTWQDAVLGLGVTAGEARYAFVTWEAVFTSVSNEGCAGQ